MKKLFAIALAFLTSVTSAQQPTWALFSVADDNKQNVGYIYQIYAIGTKYNKTPEKQPTALRLICSASDNSPPILAIYWNHENGSNNTQQLKITLDRQPFNQDWYWMQDDNLIYRSLSQSKPLIDKMKSAHLISIDWNDNAGVRHFTIFRLNGFAEHIDNFLESCKI